MGMFEYFFEEHEHDCQLFDLILNLEPMIWCLFCWRLFSARWKMAKTNTLEIRWSLANFFRYFWIPALPSSILVFGDVGSLSISLKQKHKLEISQKIPNNCVFFGSLKHPEKSRRIARYISLSLIPTHPRNMSTIFCAIVAPHMVNAILGKGHGFPFFHLQIQKTSHKTLPTSLKLTVTIHKKGRTCYIPDAQCMVCLPTFGWVLW